MSQHVLPRPEAQTGRPDAGAPAGWLVGARNSFLSAAGAVALLLVVLQAFWRGRELAGGYFTQLDYLHLRAAQEPVFTWSALSASHSSEFSPVAKVLTWVGVQLGGGSGWGAVVALVLLLQTALALLTWVVLTQILPRRWVRVPVLALALFTPLTLASTFAWDQAALYLPAALCLVAAASALLAQRQNGWPYGGRVAGLALLLGLLCSDRAVVLPVVLLFLVAATAEPAFLGVRARLRTALRDHLRLWLVLLVAVVVRFVVAARSEGVTFDAPESSRTVLAVVKEFLRQVASGAVGGPWQGNFANSTLDPSSRWVLAVAVLACTALVVLRYRRRPRVAVAVLGVVVSGALTVALLVMKSTDVSAFGTVARYATDTVLVLVLLGAAALRDVTVPAGLRDAARRSPAVVASLVAFALIVSSSVTTRELVGHLQNADDRSYVETLAAGLAREPAVVLLDGTLPEGVLHPWFGADATVSTIAGLLPESPTFGVPSDHLRIVDGLGILREVALVSPAEGDLGTGACATNVTSTPVEIPLSTQAVVGDVVLSFDYLASQDAFVRVQVGDQDIRVPVRRGLGTVQVPMKSDGFTQLTMVMAPDSGNASLCLATVRVGAPTVAAFQ